MTEIIHVDWPVIQERIAGLGIDTELNRIYGVPKNGMILAGFFVRAINQQKIDLANVILDDIVDTGATREWYAKRYPRKIFVSLFDRKKDFGGKWVQFPWEAEMPGQGETVEANITRILEYLGEDPKREGLKDSPSRIVRSWSEIYSGYSQHPDEFVTEFNKESYDQMVLLRDIEIYSMCEHHMLPFFGKAHVAYIPSERILGISKLARLVDTYARRLQIQERIGEQVTTFLMEQCSAQGAACIIEAQHLCMRMRGISKQNSTMVTSSLKGVFMETGVARTELLQLINQK